MFRFLPLLALATSLATAPAPATEAPRRVTLAPHPDGSVRWVVSRTAAACPEEWQMITVRPEGWEVEVFEAPQLEGHCYTLLPLPADSGHAWWRPICEEPTCGHSSDLLLELDGRIVMRRMQLAPPTTPTDEMLGYRGQGTAWRYFPNPDGSFLAAGVPGRRPLRRSRLLHVPYSNGQDPRGRTVELWPAAGPFGSETQGRLWALEVSGAWVAIVADLEPGHEVALQHVAELEPGRTVTDDSAAQTLWRSVLQQLVPELEDPTIQALCVSQEGRLAVLLGGQTSEETQRKAAANERGLLTLEFSRHRLATFDRQGQRLGMWEVGTEAFGTDLTWTSDELLAIGTPHDDGIEVAFHRGDGREVARIVAADRRNVPAAGRP